MTIFSLAFFITFHTLSKTNSIIYTNHFALYLIYSILFYDNISNISIHDWHFKCSTYWYISLKNTKISTIWKSFVYFFLLHWFFYWYVILLPDTIWIIKFLLNKQLLCFYPSTSHLFKAIHLFLKKFCI